jgi:hypothetical protein
MLGGPTLVSPFMHSLLCIVGYWKKIYILGTS